MKALTLDLVQSQLKPKQRLLINEDTLQEIRKLSEDPDYGQEFLDCYLDHLNVLKNNQNRGHTQYLNAVKFFGLVESGNNITDAYIKTFPDRYAHRTRHQKIPEKALLRSEASRYNRSVMVNEIRKVAVIPIQLIHRHVLHEAILAQADLMRNARSEMVRQKAAACLITELKPTEDQVISVEVKDGSRSAIEELRKATERLAAAEHQSVMAGVPLKRIAESVLIIEGEVEEEEEEDGT